MDTELGEGECVQTRRVVAADMHPLPCVSQPASEESF